MKRRGLRGIGRGDQRRIRSKNSLFLSSMFAGDKQEVGWPRLSDVIMNSLVSIAFLAFY